ncbi:MAG: hypothetical protein CM1200mP18_20370 [Gammaproteobacteria bacterium]|nr:MAG: hypothetical protein CM1200mP18_20370 [Gammaproteobacteria bacterium]
MVIDRVCLCAGGDRSGHRKPPPYQDKELRYVLEQSGSVALFLVKRYRGNPMHEIAVKATEGLTAVREVVDVDDHAELFQRATGHRCCRTCIPMIRADSIYFWNYGVSKRAVLAHRSLTNNARFYAKRAQATSESTWANFMPMFHTSGCGMISLGVFSSVARWCCSSV